LEEWEEFIYEKRREVSTNGKLFKYKLVTTENSCGTNGLTCLKCGKEYNGNDLKSDAEYELFERIYANNN
jgi:hypothetical protein